MAGTVEERDKLALSFEGIRHLMSKGSLSLLSWSLVFGLGSGPGPGPGPASQAAFTPMLSTREREEAAGPSCECFELQQRLDAAGSVPMDIAAAVDI